MIKKVVIRRFYNKTRMIFPGVLFLLLLAAAGCKNDPKEISALTNKNQMMEDRAKDVTIIYSQKGKVQFRLFAHLFIRNDNAKPSYIDLKKGLKVESFNDSGKVESTLTAKYARYYEQKGNILIRDSIVLVNLKGDTLLTNELVWNQQIQKFFTEKPVTIKTPTQVTYGDGLEANEDFSWYQIKNLKGVVQVNKNEVPQ